MEVEPANDRARRVQRMALAIILLVFAWVLWVAYGPSERVPASSLPPSTPAGELPLAKLRTFLQHVTVGPATPYALAGVLVLLAGVAVRESRREERNDDAPQLLAVLLGLYALLVPAAWLGMHFALAPRVRAALGAPSLYYVVVGVLTLASAVYLFFGRRAARSWYGLALAVAWGWSFVEFGPASRQFWMQVGMPTLVALYLFSSRVSGRLQPDALAKD